jgi:hypothetical protein
MSEFNEAFYAVCTLVFIGCFARSMDACAKCLERIAIAAERLEWLDIERIADQIERMDGPNG